MFFLTDQREVQRLEDLSLELNNDLHNTKATALKEMTDLKAATVNDIKLTSEEGEQRLTDLMEAAVNASLARGE